MPAREAKITRAEVGLLKRRMDDYRKAHKMAAQLGYQRNVPVWGGATRKLCLRVTAKMGYKSPVGYPTLTMLYNLGVRPKPTTPGHKALKWLGEHRPIEDKGRNNRSARLDRWWRNYAKGKSTYIGSPWCGLTVWAAYYYGAGIDLREATIAYTPSVTANARANKHHVRVIQPKEVREGDLVLFDWAGPDGKTGLDDPAYQTDHIAIARGPVNFKTGTIKTREGNTQPGAFGDQSGRDGGDGVFDRERATYYVICYARVVR